MRGWGICYLLRAPSAVCRDVEDVGVDAHLLDVGEDGDDLRGWWDGVVARSRLRGAGSCISASRSIERE